MCGELLCNDQVWTKVQVAVSCDLIQEPICLISDKDNLCVWVGALKSFGVFVEEGAYLRCVIFKIFLSGTEGDEQCLWRFYVCAAG